MKSPRSPQVSVIMPCYNHARYLPEAIEAVLGQSYDNLELIIVDDCSIDNSIDVINAYKKLDNRIIAINHNKNMGVSKARNDAISISRGNYIGFCDADDVWEMGKLQIQLDFIEDSGCDVIYSDSIIIDTNGVPTGKRFSSTYGVKVRENIFNQLLISNFINTQTVLLRKRCVDTAGPFEEHFKYLEDWIYWLKVARKHTFLYIDEPLARYRVHAGSTKKDTEGYSECRIEGFNFILSNFPDIPMRLKSRIYYELGIAYGEVGEKVKARNHLLQSFKMDKSNLKSFLRFALAAIL